MCTSGSVPPRRMRKGPGRVTRRVAGGAGAGAEGMGTAVDTCVGLLRAAGRRI